MSGHSYYDNLPSETYRRILRTIEDSPISITPMEISSKTDIRHSTVKKYVRTLEKMGLVARDFYGHYIANKDLVTLGGSMVNGDFPRLHCLRLRVRSVCGDARCWVKKSDVVKVTFQIHSNETATVFVDCVGDYSLDYVAFRLLLDSILAELGIEDLSLVTVSSFEFLKDFEGVRLDGGKAVTLKTFDGSIRRVYQKRFGIRDEVKVVGSRRIEDVLALMQGGVSQYNILQLLFMNFKEIEAERQAMKFQNRLVSDAVSTMKGFVEAVEVRGSLKYDEVNSDVANSDVVNSEINSRRQQKIQPHNWFHRLCNFMAKEIILSTK